jgi:hypothetical protein
MDQKTRSRPHTGYRSLPALGKGEPCSCTRVLKRKRHPKAALSSQLLNDLYSCIT